MELIRINNSKLKIMLTEEELKKYEIDCDNEETPADGCRYTGGREFRSSIQPVLDSVREKCGFDTCGSRVLVQLFPSRSGGCEMFVTKLSGFPQTDENDRGDEAVKKTKDCGQKNGVGCDVWIFTAVSDMISACRLLCSCGYSGSSSAYISENGLCHLFLSPDAAWCIGPGIISSLSEFGKHGNVFNSRIYVSEHGKKLCGAEAVGHLSVF